MPDTPDHQPAPPPDDFAYDVFVSYSRNDVDWVQHTLLPRLDEWNLRYITQDTFEPGAPWVEEFDRAAETSRKMLLVLTQQYLDDTWTVLADQLGQTLDPASKQRQVIPLLKGTCTLPSRLRRLVPLDFVTRQEWDRLREALNPAWSPRQPMDIPLDTIPAPASLPQGSRMPLSRNPLFVGREADLRELARVLKAGATAAIGQLEIAAATGLGGIGKTQLACEFVHRYGQYFKGGVFWLSFADAAAVPAEVAACGGADAMQLHPDFGTLPLDDQVKLVQRAWAGDTPRLLVFDNCEDETLLDTWRPTTGGSRVLVTSRRAQWAPTLGVHPLPLEVLPRAESLALLRKLAPNVHADDAELDVIAAALGDLPLALHLAGSFLEKYRRVVTPAAYLERLSKPTLLDDRSLRAADLSPTKHVQHVARTFEQSYERLDAADPTDALALKLLARAAYFAPGEPLPRSLLVLTLNLPKDDPDAALLAEDALTRLIDLGLLETEAEDALRLHRLLAAFVRAVASDDAAQAAVEEMILGMARHFNEAGDPRPLLAVQPHLRAITNTARQREDEQAAKLCNTLGYHLHIGGDYAGARGYYEWALAIWERVLGSEHPDTASSLNNLGGLLQEQGDYTGAWGYLERALAIWERVLGLEHPDTATNLNNLGRVLHVQGDYAGARGYYERALAIVERVLGPEHRDTAASLNNLGEVLRAQGDLAASRWYLERALAIWERVLGPEHPDTAASLNNLGLVLHAQGDYAGARGYYERALAIVERVLGLEHPNMAASLNNLGTVLQDQGNYAGAQGYYERSLAIVERVLGAEHPNTATSLNNLGLVLRAQGDLAASRWYHERALVILEQRLGPDHPYTHSTRNSLAGLDAQPQTAEQQIAGIERRAEAAVEQALAAGSAEDRAALAERIEVAATAYAAGQPEDSAWVALAGRLRTLAARLREAGQ